MSQALLQECSREQSIQWAPLIETEITHTRARAIFISHDKCGIGNKMVKEQSDFDEAGVGWEV